MTYQKDEVLHPYQYVCNSTVFCQPIVGIVRSNSIFKAYFLVLKRIYDGYADFGSITDVSINVELLDDNIINSIRYLDISDFEDDDELSF